MRLAGAFREYDALDNTFDLILWWENSRKHFSSRHQGETVIDADFGVLRTSVRHAVINAPRQSFPPLPNVFLSSPSPHCRPPIKISLYAAKSHNARRAELMRVTSDWGGKRRPPIRRGDNSGCHTSCQSRRRKTGIDEEAERLSPLSGSHLL